MAAHILTPELRSKNSADYKHTTRTVKEKEEEEEGEKKQNR